MNWKNRIIRQETVPISDIVPNSKNWRKHPAKQQTHVKGSLDNLGWIRSVLVNLRTSKEWDIPDRNKKTVIDGHLRLDLALKNGENKIPVEYVDLSPDEERIALTSIDPLAAMAETDEKMLDALLASIDCAVPEITDMLDDIGTLEGIEQDDPEPLDTEPQISRAEELRKEWGTELGQMWQCGDHRVICGDCTDPAVVKRLMQGDKASLFATDPPYGVAYGTETGADNIKFKAIANDENDGKKLQAFLESAFTACKPFLKENAAWYLWHAQMTQGFFAAAAAAAAAVIIHRQIIWVKPSLIMGHGDYHWKHELCFYGWVEGNRPPWYGDRKQTTVWEVGRENDHIHPTQKPVELYIRPLNFNTKPGEIALDPFLGSGTTTIACENLWRKCRGCEIDPGYVAVILQRYKDTFPGKEIRLIE